MAHIFVVLNLWQFYQFASTIRDSTEFNLLGVLEATDGMSDVLTSEAENSNAEWPFVTMNAFEVFVRHTRAQASSEFIFVAPIVIAQHLDQWGNYSTRNQGWIEESFKVSGERNMERIAPIPLQVYRKENKMGEAIMQPEDGSAVYPAAPFWQMSPPPLNTSIVNFNSLSVKSYQEMYSVVVQNRRWTLGTASPNAFVDYTNSKEHDSSHTHYPHTPLMYPVYRTLDQPDSDVVAIVVNILPWDNYLSGALPQGVDGVYCVLHNIWGQAFTYMINGNDAKYIGEGDLHDKHFDDMEFVIDFSDFFQGNDGLSASLESAGEHFQYWLVVYPSQKLEDDYKSTAPMVFALISVSAFAVMTLTFLLYDWFVISKNNKILDAAAHSDAILSVSYTRSTNLQIDLMSLILCVVTQFSQSLFPKEVKDRLLQENEKKRTASKKTNNLKDFLNTDDASGGIDDAVRSKPIAELFPQTTVFFADLVGFTSWSSTREPSSVFVLLETLFGAFDKIARRNMVYKVSRVPKCPLAASL